MDFVEILKQLAYHLLRQLSLLYAVCGCQGTQQERGA